MVAAACLFGGGSLLLFIARPLGAYLHFGWPVQSVLAWDTALSLIFFAQHSIMIRRPVRSAMHVPEPYWGAVYAAASGVAFASVALFWQSSDGVLVEIAMPYRMTMHMFSLCALAIFIWGFAVLRDIDVLGVRAVLAHRKGLRPKAAPFVVRGPYCWVRHPLYFAAIVLIWCEGDLTGDRLLFDVLWTVWITLATRWEEADLSRDIGEAYRRYQMQVPMLIPWRGPRTID